MCAEPMDRAGQSGSNGHSAVSHTRLWFGFLATAIAWASAGCLDVVIVWGCAHQEVFGVPPAHPVARILFVLFAALLLAVSVYSGFVSYRNWRRLSAQAEFLEAQAVERREYMAVLGVLITASLGMGIVWLSLPTFFLDLCWRAR